MQRVAIVTDTTGYLPADLVERHGIHLVSLYVNWEEESEREADMPNFDDFYRRLRSADRLPTTSQPSIGDFLEAYEPLVDQGLEVVSVHISGGISGTVESARQAKEQLAERKGVDRVTVIDSERSAGGLGLMVLAGARVAQAGGSLDEVVERVKTARADLKMWFAVDTLEYLRRGGRIGPASAWLGSALKIKPILTLDKEITPIERVRTGAKAMRRLLEYMEQLHADGGDGWVVQHVQAPEEAQQMVDATREMTGRDPVFVSEVGPVIGAHVGPGLLGIGGSPAPRPGVAELALGAAAEGAQPAADHEPEHCRTRDRRGAVLVDLAPPVGQHLDLHAQVLDRARQLAAVALDRRAYLLGCGSPRLASPGPGRRPAGPRGARAPRGCSWPPRSPCRASAASPPGSSCRR